MAERGCWSHTLWYVLPHTEAWVGSPYIHHPALSALFLHLFRFTFSVPLHQALGSVSFPGPGRAIFRSCSIVCCAALELVWRRGQWGWQEKNWTLCKDSTKYSKVIRIRLEQVINESSMAVTGQSNIYRTSSISIAAAERKQWSPGAPRPARGTHADQLPQNLEAGVELLTCPGGGQDSWGGSWAKKMLGLCSTVF